MSQSTSETPVLDLLATMTTESLEASSPDATAHAVSPAPRGHHTHWMNLSPRSSRVLYDDSA